MDCGDTAISVLAPTSRHDRVTHRTNLTDPFPSKPTLQHRTAMQLQLKSWKVAGLEQVWESANLLQKWCKMVPGWPAARTPHFHLNVFTQFDCL